MLIKRIVIFLKGIMMGAADVIPGVSGGTIAFISGIYEELIESINSINLKNTKLLFSLKLKQFWKAINGNFILPLLLGIMFSILTLANSISSIMNAQEETKEKVLLWSFFFGLIVASVIYMGRMIKKWDVKSISFLAFGCIFTLTVSMLSPTNGPDSLWFIFISGIIAICAMILPGISGSFILLLIGAYSIIFGKISGLLEGIRTMDSSMIASNIIPLSVFILGCAIGIISFARLVSWLFKKHHNSTIALLTGFLLGSLLKIWPWKETEQYRTNSHGIEIPYIQTNIWPSEFAEINGDSYLILAILFVIFGFAILFGVEMLGNKLKNKTINR
ncbi:MAG: DUF368 domain-containing protein [Bacteroidales bacterium]